MERRRDGNRDNGQGTLLVQTAQRPACAERSFLPATPRQRALAVILSLLVLLFAVQIAHEVLAPSETSTWVARPGRAMGGYHSRPIIERNGRRLLWARGAPDGHDAEWFDVTESRIDPERFQYGIGKDTIPSIDSPQFLDAEDPRLGDAGIDDATRIIGFVHDGDARAYPLDILDRHELVNDTVGGKPVTVGW